MNQVAENSERRRRRVFMRELDRIAHAEAHTEMLSADDAEGSLRSIAKGITLHRKVIMNNETSAVKLPGHYGSSNPGRLNKRANGNAASTSSRSDDIAEAMSAAPT